MDTVHAPKFRRAPSWYVFVRLVFRVAREGSRVDQTMHIKPLLILLICGRAVADIPAHCLQTDVLGTWSFQLSPPVEASAVTQKCDQLDVLPYALDITLSAGTRAVDSNGNVGTWTMIYDQGFEVTIPDQMDLTKNRTFFHFMQYSQAGSKVTTDCGSSLRNFGWVHDAPAKAGAAPANWQCYVAKKLAGAVMRDYVAAAHGKGRLLGVPRSKQWMADRPRAVPDPRPDAVKYAGLPTSWDWSNVSGQSYIEPMRDQLSWHSGSGLKPRTSKVKNKATASHASGPRLGTAARASPLLAPRCSRRARACATRAATRPT